VSKDFKKQVGNNTIRISDKTVKVIVLLCYVVLANFCSWFPVGRAEGIGPPIIQGKQDELSFLESAFSENGDAGLLFQREEWGNELIRIKESDPRHK
jgi:hypothetical protein